MDKIPGFLKQNNSNDFQYHFFNFLFDILNKDVNDKYNEGIIRKFIILTCSLFRVILKHYNIFKLK